jgi:Protein of unknown function (DUF2800)
VQRKLTLSKVEHASHCLYPFREDVDYPPFAGNELAEIGNRTHNAIVCAVHGMPMPDLCDTSEIYFDQWRNRYRRDDFGPAICELAVALNVITGACRVLGWNINRAYAEHGATEDEICGSIDLVCNPAGILTVMDWKTGLQYYLTRYKNPQVRAYAAIMARIMGIDHVRCVTVVINESGVWEYEDELVGEHEIASVIRDIQAMDAEIALGDPQPRPGTHCREKYCELRATCPALVEVSTEMMTKLPTAVPLATKEDVATTIEKLFALKAQADAIWELVDARVTEIGEDIPLTGGKVYGRKETHRESIQATEGCRKLLTARLGPEIDEAVKMSITKDSIKAAVKRHAPKGKAAAMYREIEEQLRDLGVVKESVSVGLGIK